ncbi:MAG: hypothetical protein HY953_07615, partial [Candidatus Rokubacteria bacterium]|nr:hypothetical protein [Candidatus Rokubacteria bacterium]
MPLLVLGDAARVIVKAEVDETDVGKRKVKPEDPAKIQDMKLLETKIEVAEGGADHFASTIGRSEMVSTLRLVLDSP